MSEFTLKGAPVVVKSFGGFGVQLNQHAFAKQTLDLVPGASNNDLKAKIRALAPHVVRIFWSQGPKQDGFLFDRARPKTQQDEIEKASEKSRWDSFLEVVALAQEIGATINITWQGGALGTVKQQQRAASQLAEILELAVKTGATNLRWVTIANEPNTPPHPMRPEMLGDTYIELDKLLKAKGLRKQIRFMGGDLIEGSKEHTSRYYQFFWFEYMHKEKSMQGLFDAFSSHIYWDYDDIGRFKTRLDQVRVDLNKLAGKGSDMLQYGLPVYVTEFGTRSKDINKKAGLDPGNYHDRKTKKKKWLCETNIAAFQAAWFQIHAARMGCAGLLKWDCNFGKYDNGSQQYYVIGPDEKGRKGWALQPGYHLLRLFTRTTAPGWKVVAVRKENPVPGSGTKHLVAFKGPGTTVTVIGLDEGGGHADAAPATPVSYEIGGLTPRGRYKLLVWNKGGKGGLVFDRVVTATANGVAPVDVPMRAVFALTSKELPSDLGG
jgi:hypothetical protein